MKNIFLMQYNNYTNGHILIKNSGEIEFNKNEYDILNFIFGNKIQDFYPLIIEYELTEEKNVSDETKNTLISTIKHYVDIYQLNPFLNISTIKEIFDCNISDYFFENYDDFKSLKMNIVDKNFYLINEESNYTIQENENIEKIIMEASSDEKISAEEIENIKQSILNSFNINTVKDQEIAEKLMKESIKNGLLKKEHNPDEIVTMSSLLAILNRLKNK